MAGAIEVRGLVKRYGELSAVAGVDFSVASGTIFSFLGPNGAGKTTTVEILEGLRHATSGDVRVLGLDPWHQGAELHRRIGVIPQDFRFFDKITPKEAVEYYRALFHTKVDPKALLGLGVGAEDDIENRRTHHDSEPDHDHDDFESFVVPIPEVGDPARLVQRIAVATEAADVLRVKGFAAVTGKPLRLLVQAVGPRVTHQYDRPWMAAEARHGRLVVIGLKGLNRTAVESALLD